MSRLHGTLVTRAKENRREWSRDGLQVSSILAGANEEDTGAYLEMQGCAKYLLKAVADFQQRQARRGARERAMMLATWKVMHHG